uniref:Uncharacterized protein n=1 Tax=Caenorhabditis japonica TaxID=281687 RepID=A0A8R1IPZ0_CAEJA
MNDTHLRFPRFFLALRQFPYSVLFVFVFPFIVIFIVVAFASLLLLARKSNYTKLKSVFSRLSLLPLPALRARRAPGCREEKEKRPCRENRPCYLLEQHGQTLGRFRRGLHVTNNTWEKNIRMTMFL